METRYDSQVRLNLIGVPGYHNKNRNGTTTNGAGKDPTPLAGHPTAPKTKKTPMRNWVESTPPITRRAKTSTKTNRSDQYPVFKV
jgi:hypothetical protein